MSMNTPLIEIGSELLFTPDGASRGIPCEVVKISHRNAWLGGRRYLTVRMLADDRGLCRRTGDVEIRLEGDHNLTFPNGDPTA